MELLAEHLRLAQNFGWPVFEGYGPSNTHFGDLRANLDAVRQLMLYLAKDCCGGRAELCEPLVAELSHCC